MATQKDLAEFHRVSLSAVKQWSKEKQHEKKVQLVAGIDLEVSKLLGEISQLVYLYNCKHIEGVNQVKKSSIELFYNSVFVSSASFSREIILDSKLAVADLQWIVVLLKTEIY